MLYMAKRNLLIQKNSGWNKDMKYVYPKLSDIDLGVTRIGGLGLGNMLFTYARALLCVRDHGAELIWPTWNSIPVGQILRREENKRFYRDLFVNRKEGIAGWKKAWLLMTRKKMSEAEWKTVSDKQDYAVSEGKVIVFSGMEDEFVPLMGKGNSDFLYRHFQSVLQDKNKEALLFEPGNGICVHVRLGDFTRGTQQELKAGISNMSIPIFWYASIIKQLQKVLPEKTPVYIFSDGTNEELAELLELPYTERKTYGTAVADIMAMTKAKIFIASGSTFSRWVRFLGQMTTIAYPGQLKQQLLEEGTDNFEIEAEVIPMDYLERLKKLYVNR